MELFFGLPFRWNFFLVHDHTAKCDIKLETFFWSEQFALFDGTFFCSMDHFGGTIFCSELFCPFCPFWRGWVGLPEFEREEHSSSRTRQALPTLS